MMMSWAICIAVGASLAFFINTSAVKEPWECEEGVQPKKCLVADTLTKFKWNWWQSNFYCQVLNNTMKLASVRTAQEHAAIVHFIHEEYQNPSNYYWLAGSCWPNCQGGKENDWYWTDRYPVGINNSDERLRNDRISAGGFTNWAPGEPTKHNPKNEQLALVMSKALNWKWIALPVMEAIDGHIRETNCNGGRCAKSCSAKPVEVFNKNSFLGDSYTPLGLCTIDKCPMPVTTGQPSTARAVTTSLYNKNQLI